MSASTIFDAERADCADYAGDPRVVIAQGDHVRAWYARLAAHAMEQHRSVDDYSLASNSWVD
jgi:hypothetical protein